MTELDRRTTWSLAELGRAIEALAQASRLAPGRGEPLPAPPAAPDPREVDLWVTALANRVGLETQREELRYTELASALGELGTSVLQVATPEGPRFLAILDGRGRDLIAVTPELRRVRIAAATVIAALCATQEAPHRATVAELVSHVPLSRREAVTARLLARLLPDVMIPGIWILRPAPGPLRQAIAQQRFGKRLLVLLAARTLQLLLWIGSWTLLGWAVLHGRIAGGWVLAWALLLLSSIPLQLATSYLTDALTLRLGMFMRARLFEGALRLGPDELKGGGIGSMLGHVFESTMIEQMALTGGMQTALAVVDSTFAIAILALGAGALLTVPAFVVLLVAIALLTRTYVRRRGTWTAERIRLTHDVIERMLGHRTRLVQQAPARWHDGEDDALEAYLEHSRSHDRVAVAIAAASRVWPVLGALALVPALLGGSSPTSLAIAIGGFVLATRALRRLARGTTLLGAALASWRHIAHLMNTAARPAVEVTPAGVLLTAERRARRDRFDEERTQIEHRTALELHDLSFRYRPEGRAVLDHLALKVMHGDRILLEGSSGSGKSTLASVMCGLRAPQSGTLLLDGLDRSTLGMDGWRRLASAPQFHENHVFSGSLAFNLLLGRSWPPAPGDLERAERVCHELGLGPLLRRMPAGLAQTVGESGWQLSHGERSRLFIARALLQDADIVILDESFGALDPESLAVAMRCVFRRARTLVVIAHP